MTEERDTVNETQGTSGANLSVVPAPQPKKSASKRATLLPDDWAPTDRMMDWAKAKGCPSRKWVDDQTEAFTEWAQARGTKYVNWDSGWRNWIIRKLEDAAKHTRTNRPPKQLGMFS